MNNVFSPNLWNFSISDNRDGISIKANENLSVTQSDPYLFESKSFSPLRDIQQKHFMIMNCATKLKQLLGSKEHCKPKARHTAFPTSHRLPDINLKLSACRCSTDVWALLLRLERAAAGPPCGEAFFTRPRGRARDHADRKTWLRKHESTEPRTAGL